MSPLYEFSCPCGNQFEEIKKYAEPEAKCPKCGVLLKPKLCSKFSWKWAEGHWAPKITRNEDYFYGRSDTMENP